MKLAVISDPHFAGSEEKARYGWEGRAIKSRLPRLAASLYRRWIWLADPTAHNHLLDRALTACRDADWVVANGDYSCDSAFIGVADDAALASARECLSRLREALGPRLLATFGDHELGKMSLFGGVGGLRLKSWDRCLGELQLTPAWCQRVGRYVLIGLTSSLVALEAFFPELLAEEAHEWERLRAEHLEEIRRAFAKVGPADRILLFCHDPTALPILARESWMRDVLPRIEHTIIGHLHSELVLSTDRFLAGMPELGFLGNTARRFSGALRKARDWSEFQIVLCPSLSGIQLLKDGGYLELEFEPEGNRPTKIRRCHLPWQSQDALESAPRGIKADS